MAGPEERWKDFSDMPDQYDDDSGRPPRRGRHRGPAPQHPTAGRTLLATVPIVLIGSLAASIGLAPPAHAAPHPKRFGKTDVRGAAADAGKSARKAKPSKAAPHLYTVVEGDTVSGIAGRFGLSTASVLALNGLSWQSLIFPGQVLHLSGTGTQASPPPDAIRHHTVVEGDTISGIAATYHLSTDAVLKANGLSATSIIYPGQAITLPDSAPAAGASHASASGPASAEAEAAALLAEMRRNAATIIRVGRQAGVSDYGLVIAIATAMQESGLRNLDHGDADSLGLFQQRPSMGWGTSRQILDPVHATRSFFGGAGNPNPRTRGLLDIPGWEQLSVTEAAQAVQISATPDAYAAWEPLARKMLAELG